MRALVVGDLSFRGRYHLGDEAMSQVAAQELARRGIEVTLVAGNPELTSALYGVPAVGRFGFVGVPQRDDKISLMERILEGARGNASVPTSAVDSVDFLRSADALIIAGGGNLNTIGEHHVFERLTLARLAREFGVPLYVTSQTVGPHLLPPDQELVTEIAGIARVFGVREAGSAALMRGLPLGNTKVVRTVDDAVLLEATPIDANTRKGLPERYVVASFSADERTSGLDAEAYFRELALIVDEIVEIADVDVLLVSHYGSLTPSTAVPTDSDDYAHHRVQNYALSSRVHVLPMLAATALLDLTSTAQFTISTRYHPLVFGPAVGVPAIGIVHSYYSAVRMRGALKNAGMEDLAIPFEFWRDFLGASVREVINLNRGGLAAPLKAVGERHKAYQRQWWDWIVADLSGQQSPLPQDFAYGPGAASLPSAVAADLGPARVVTEAINLDRLQMQITDRYVDIQRRRDARDHAQFREDIFEAQQEIAALRSELQEMRHRARPPGAAIRDGIRRWIQRFRA